MRYLTRTSISLVALFGFALVTIFFLTACSKKQTENRSSHEPVVIAGLYPLTGPSAQYGQYMKEGAELALDDAIRSGLIGSSEVRLIFEDATLEPAKAVSAFQKLLAIDHPTAVIAATSGVILAIKPMANRSKVVIVNPTAISPEIEDADDFCFSVIPNANVEGAFLADFAIKSGKKNAGILYRNDPSGVAFLKAFKSRLEEKGGRLVYQDAHAPNETDYRPFIVKIGALREIDVLFVASFGPEVAAYLKQAYEQGVHIRVLAYTTFYQPKVLEIAGQAANGVFFSAPEFDPASDAPAAIELRAKLLKKYGQKELNYYVASHYDAVMLVIQAISKGAVDRQGVRDYLAKLQTYEGKSGQITFLENGASTMPLRIFTVKDGKFMPVDPSISSTQF